MHLFTDGMHLDDPLVREATGHFRRLFLKLDGASARIVDQINGTGAWRGTRRALTSGRALANVAASTALVGGSCSNTDDVKSGPFLDAIHELHPRELFLYTLDYPSPSPSIVAVDFAAQLSCAEWLATRVQIPVISLWRRHRPPSPMPHDSHG